MQATVRHFDLVSRAGDVLLDDGSALAFGQAAFGASGLLRLRVGQRVRLTLDESGAVTLVTLITLGAPSPD